MPACRRAHRADALRVNTVLCAVSAQPAYRTLHVLDVGGVSVFGRETVVDGNGHIAPACHFAGFLRKLALVAARPPAAVNKYKGGAQAIPACGWLIQIELQAFSSGLPVFDILFYLQAHYITLFRFALFYHCQGRVLRPCRRIQTRRIEDK